MNLPQSTPMLAIFQVLFQLFNDLKQDISNSTLWVCDSGGAQSFSINLQETETRLVLEIQPLSGKFELNVTPETVSVRGRHAVPATAPVSSAAQCSCAQEFVEARFHSLIPLPVPILPQTSIAELSGTRLTLTMLKYGQPLPSVHIQLSEQGQLLLNATAVKSSSAAAKAQFN
jgi:hypothetical protein